MTKLEFIRKNELAENLYQVAVETEPDIFGIVEEHSNFWKQIIMRIAKQVWR